MSEEYSSPLYRLSSRIAAHELGQQREKQARGSNPLFGRYNADMPDALQGTRQVLASEAQEDVEAAIDALAAAAGTSWQNQRR